MAEHSKAEFRAIREMVGYTQQALADVLGVKVLSVKRWELPSYPQRAPQDAWDILYSALDRQSEVVEYALAKVAEIEKETGHAPDSINLRYWANEDEYIQFSTDAELGVADDWRMANANALRCAAVLMSAGYAVAWTGAPIHS